MEQESFTTEENNLKRYTKEDFFNEYNRERGECSKISTCVRAIDEQIGGIRKGTLTSILGWTGSMKSTWSINIAYSAQLVGLNVVYLSLEISKYDIWCNLLSRHSNTNNFKPIKHREIKKRELNQDELSELEKIFASYNELPRKVLYIRCRRYIAIFL